MLQSVLAHIRSWLLANTGTYLSEVYDHVRIIEHKDTAFPAFWDVNSREARPVIDDFRRNYAYMRPLSGATIETEQGFVSSCNDSQKWTIPMRIVFHVRKIENGETSSEIALTFSQFLGNYIWEKPAGSIVSDVFLLPTSAIITREEVVQAEISTAKMPDQNSELAAIDFDLEINLTPGCTIESSLCLGSLPTTFSQVSPEPLNVTTFLGPCISTTRAAAIIDRDAGILACNSIYFLTDELIYLKAVSTDRFGLNGWIQISTEADVIEYDIDDNEVYWRRNKYGLEARYSPFYIALFGNPIAALPWNNVLFQNISISDSAFTWVGFAGAVCADVSVSGISSLNVAGSSNTLSNIIVENAGSVTLGTDGASSGLVSVSSVIQIQGTSSSFSNVFAYGGSTITSTANSKVLINIWSQNTSSLTFTGVGGTMTNVRVSDFSDATIQSTVNVDTIVCVTDASITIASNSAILTRITVEASIFEIFTANSGTMTDLEIKDGANVRFTSNTRVLSDIIIQGRDCDFLDTFLPISVVRITAFESNTFATFTTTGGGNLSPDLMADSNHLGEIRVDTTASPLIRIVAIDFLSDGTYVRVISDSGTATITNTAVGAASAGQFVGDVASVALMLRSPSPDFAIYRKMNTGASARMELQSQMIFI